MQSDYLPKESVKSFHPVPGAQKSLQDTFNPLKSPLPLILTVLSPVLGVAGPLSLKAVIFRSYSLSPSLEGGPDSVHAAEFIHTGQALSSAVHGPVTPTPSALSPTQS